MTGVEGQVLGAFAESLENPIHQAIRAISVSTPPNPGCPG